MFLYHLNFSDDIFLLTNLVLFEQKVFAIPKKKIIILISRIKQFNFMN